MTSQPEKPLGSRALLAVALPIMLSNVSEPLIGVVNTAVIGRLGNPALIGGVAIGSLIFAFLFWGFGFLRLSTSGISAQATGAGDVAALSATFWQSLLLGFTIGGLLLLLSPLIRPAVVALMGGSTEVQAAAATYFSWRILSAPAALMNFVILGWFVGQARAGTAFAVQLTLNLSNMALSVLFVMQWDLAVQGVGMAALVAEYVALAIGLVLAARRLRQLGSGLQRARIFQTQAFRRIIVANTDIMVRTLLLIFAFGWFASRGARMGDDVVAANTVLLHFFEVAAYLTDGFAYAAEALVGQAIGARQRSRYREAVRLSSIWALAFGALCGAAIYLFGEPLIRLMTNHEQVIALALIYLPWAAITPVLGAACFLYDGIFTGALATREMRNMMIVSTAVFLLASWLAEPLLGNHGLWLALLLFFVARGVSFAARLPAIERRSFLT